MGEIYTYSYRDPDGNENLFCRVCQQTAARIVSAATAYPSTSTAPWWQQFHWSDSVNVFEKGLLLPQWAEITRKYDTVDSITGKRVMLRDV